MSNAASHVLDLAVLLACAAATALAGLPAAGAAQPPDKPGAAARAAHEGVHATPLVMHIDHEPVPVKGADRRYHLVYEIQIENFTGDQVRVDRVQVLDGDDSRAVMTLDAAAAAARLVVRDRSAVPGLLGPSQLGILYLHVTADRPDEIPKALEHRLTVSSKDRTGDVTAARTAVAPPADLVLDAPLRGERYIAGDGCCESTRHLRATLALNGNAYVAQRFAIDWEQLDARGQIYAGDPRSPGSYVIYGKPVYAVADARVVAALDGMPDSPVGALPNLPPDRADGNHVILDLGAGRFALYAHFKPRSVRVHRGESVRSGQVLGLVGTSGNSSEPHLHFQVTDGPSSLMSNGVPYLLRTFEARQRGVSTAAFDQATVDGKSIRVEALSGSSHHEHELPLDLWICDLPQ